MFMINDKKTSNDKKQNTKNKDEKNEKTFTIKKLL